MKKSITLLSAIVLCFLFITNLQANNITDEPPKRIVTKLVHFNDAGAVNLSQSFINSVSLDTQSDWLHIGFSHLVKSGVNYKVKDMHGRTLFNGSAFAPSNQNVNLWYNTQLLPEGYYYLQIEDRDFFVNLVFERKADLSTNPVAGY